MNPYESPRTVSQPRERSNHNSGFKYDACFRWLGITFVATIVAAFVAIKLMEYHAPQLIQVIAGNVAALLGSAFIAEWLVLMMAMWADSEPPRR